MQLFWGNYKYWSSLKLEYCFHPLATNKLKELSVLNSDEDANRALAETDLTDWDCTLTEDLSKIMVPHGGFPLSDACCMSRRCLLHSHSNYVARSSSRSCATTPSPVIHAVRCT